MNLSSDTGRNDAANGLVSLWAEHSEPGPSFPSLSERLKADVVVVGAGFTGLSAALHLAEGGADVVVLESHEPGWGGSGRNGGQVIPGLKYDPPELLSMFGPDLGPRLAQFAGSASAMVFDLIDRHSIDCDARRCGWIQPAHNAEMETTLRKRAESWAALGADVELLDRARVAELLGSSAYRSGWLDKRGGCLNPLAYARGLAAAAASKGVRIFANSSAHRIDRGPQGFTVESSNGAAVQAGQVVIGTNAYTGDLVAKLPQSLIPVHSFQIATAPLDDAVRKTILPHGHVSSDSRRVLLYFRLDPQGRFLMGGVGSAGEPTDQRKFRHLYDAVRHIYPQINAPFDYHWYGKVALTRDFLPHLHEPEPGLHCALGYNGRGVAMATALGSLLARRVNGEPAEALPFPTTPIRPIPFHGLRNLYVAAARTYYRLRDIAL